MQKRQYFACKIAQRGSGQSVELAAFVANVKDILQWAGIRRVGEDEGGVQRILKPSRVRAIKRFLESNRCNTIPTAVILAFSEEATEFRSVHQNLSPSIEAANLELGQWGLLSFEFDEKSPEHARPALIVDGQHRLKGMAELREDVPVLVVALISASLQEQAFQFVVINRKSEKVPTDNVKAIIAEIDEDALQDRLLNAGITYGRISAVLKDIHEQTDSPFRNLLDWPLTHDGERRQVQLTTVEACLRYIRGKIQELESDDDTLKDFFLAMWRSVKATYPALWAQNEKFMKKVSINALNEYITDRLENAWLEASVDIYETEQVQEKTSRILELIPEEFWRSPWTIKLQDNSVVRAAIKDDLIQIARNGRISKREWSYKLKLVGRESVATI